METITATFQQTLPASSDKLATWPYSQPAKQQLCGAITAQLETIHSNSIWAQHLDFVSLPVPRFQQHNRTSAAPAATASDLQPADTCITPALVSDSKPTQLSSHKDVTAKEGKTILATIHGARLKQAASAEALMLPGAGGLKHELPAYADECWQRCLLTAAPSALDRLASFHTVNFGSVQPIRDADKGTSAQLPGSADVTTATAYVVTAPKAKAESMEAAVCLTSIMPCGSHSSQPCSAETCSSQPVQQPDSGKMQHASTMVDTNSREGLHK